MKRNIIISTIVGIAAIVGASLFFTASIHAVPSTPSLMKELTPAKTSANSFSTEQQADIQKIMHDYLISNPEVLMQASQALQQKMLEQQKTKTANAIRQMDLSDLLNNPNSPVAGNKNGTTTLVEYFDYQCPHCRNLATTLDATMKANPDLRVVFKEFPIYGAVSELASSAALAANKQGKYYAYHQALYNAKTQINNKLVLQIANQLKLNRTQFKKDLKDNAIAQEIKHNQSTATQLGLMGTPAIIIMPTKGNAQSPIQFFPGETSQANLQKMIDAVK
ncbi:MAG: DsbA family protein [Pseudomonadota bacterium]